MTKLVALIFMLTSVITCDTTLPSQDENSSLAMLQAENLENFTCVNAQADKAISVSEAKEKISGEWQLKAVMTMIPQNEVPNFVLKITDDLSVSVFRAGKKIHEDELKITEESGENYRVLKLESSRQDFSNGDFNFLYGNLRVCEKELFIDNGIMFDAPGYFFRKP